MSVLKYFKNTPRSPPPIGRQALSVIFFFKSAMRSLEKKALSPPQRATGACRPRLGRPLGPARAPAHGCGRGACRPPCGRQGGACRPPLGRPGYPPYKSSNPPLPSSFEPENSTKNSEKKRVVRRRKAAKPYRIQHL